ncbi:hypothetical protein GQ53DRAFT_289407 [Thozetella sp. PMI_491]|nr:hypothetical protein GQ53DRAFT_289407 [Thozetella sp. PMI_491]
MGQERRREGAKEGYVREWVGMLRLSTSVRLARGGAKGGAPEDCDKDQRPAQQRIVWGRADQQLFLGPCGPSCRGLIAPGVDKVSGISRSKRGGTRQCAGYRRGNYYAVGLDWYIQRRDTKVGRAGLLSVAVSAN